MAQPKLAAVPQMGFEEVTVHDPALLKLVEQWDSKSETAKGLREKERALKIKDHKEKVMAKLEWDHDTEVHFRIGNTGMVIKAKPAQPREVEFTSEGNPTIRLSKGK